MFDHLSSRPVRKLSSPVLDLSLTTAFLAVVVQEGFRLSYGAVAQAARSLGEDRNTQILAQRGAVLVKQLPSALQPFVCRKAGDYSAKIKWSVEVPSDLGDRPVISVATVGEAIAAWRASLD